MSNNTLATDTVLITGPDHAPIATCPACGVAAEIGWEDGEPLWAETEGGITPPCPHVTLPAMQWAAFGWAAAEAEAMADGSEL